MEKINYILKLENVFKLVDKLYTENEIADILKFKMEQYWKAYTKYSYDYYASKIKVRRYLYLSQDKTVYNLSKTDNSFLELQENVTNLLNEYSDDVYNEFGNNIQLIFTELEDEAKRSINELVSLI